MFRWEANNSNDKRGYALNGKLRHCKVVSASTKKTLLNDIKKNIYRVYSILLRLNSVQDGEDIMTNALEKLDREELLSPKQFGKLGEHENIDLSTVTNITNICY